MKLFPTLSYRRSASSIFGYGFSSVLVSLYTPPPAKYNAGFFVSLYVGAHAGKAIVDSKGFCDADVIGSNAAQSFVSGAKCVPALLKNSCRFAVCRICFKIGMNRNNLCPLRGSAVTDPGSLLWPCTSDEE